MHKANMPKIQELKKPNIHEEICYDGDIRQNVLKACESKKPNLCQQKSTTIDALGQCVWDAWVKNIWPI